jgi:hypothetical protein
MAQNHSYSRDTPRILSAASSISATLASSVAAHRNALIPLTLGHSVNAIELLVPIAPAVHDATDLKAHHAFDFLSDLLCQHDEQYSSAELIAACNHIPGSSYNANQEATTICSSLHAAFFTTTNLTDLGFRDNHAALSHLRLQLTLPLAFLVSLILCFAPPSIPQPLTPASQELVSLLSFGLPYLKPSSLLSLPLITPVAIFSSDSTAPLTPFPKLLLPLPYIKLIWALFQPMSLLSLVPAMTLFLSILPTVILCPPRSRFKSFSSATQSFLPLPLPFCCRI